MIWSAFKTYVLRFLPVESQRIGIEHFRDQQLRAGVIDLQSLIPALQVGHTTSVAAPGFTVDGVLAGTCAAPDGVVRKIWLVSDVADTDRPGSSNRKAYTSGSWAERQNLVLGLDTTIGRWLLSPDQQTILLSPVPDDDHHVEIEWDGIKRTFGESDPTPFNEEMAEAVAEFVKAKIVQHVERDMATAATHFQEYARLRRRIHADIKQKENA